MSVICPCPRALKASIVRRRGWGRKAMRVFLLLSHVWKQTLWFVWNCSENKSMVNPSRGRRAESHPRPCLRESSRKYHNWLTFHSGCFPFRQIPSPLVNKKEITPKPLGLCNLICPQTQCWIMKQLKLVLNNKTIQINPNYKCFREISFSIVSVATHTSVYMYEKGGIFIPIRCSCHSLCEMKF